jgi:hypothetical protein
MDDHIYKREWIFDQQTCLSEIILKRKLLDEYHLDSKKVFCNNVLPFWKAQEEHTWYYFPIIQLLNSKDYYTRLHLINIARRTYISLHGSTRSPEMFKRLAAA